jgi:hypothetical protein
LRRTPRRTIAGSRLTLERTGSIQATDDAERPQVRARPSRAATRSPTVVACALTAVLALSAIPTLHALEDATGSSPTPPAEQAWVVGATRAAYGVNIGDPVVVDVVPGTDQPLGWTSFDGKIAGPSGHVQGHPGATLSFSVLTFVAVPESWFVIHIAGLPEPIRVWIR